MCVINNIAILTVPSQCSQWSPQISTVSDATYGRAWNVTWALLRERAHQVTEVRLVFTLLTLQGKLAFLWYLWRAIIVKPSSDQPKHGIDRIIDRLARNRSWLAGIPLIKICELGIISLFAGIMHNIRSYWRWSLSKCWCALFMTGTGLECLRLFARILLEPP